MSLNGEADVELEDGRGSELSLAEVAADADDGSTREASGASLSAQHRVAGQRTAPRPCPEV